MAWGLEPFEGLWGAVEGLDCVTSASVLLAASAIGAEVCGEEAVVGLTDFLLAAIIGTSSSVPQRIVVSPRFKHMGLHVPGLSRSGSQVAVKPFSPTSLPKLNRPGESSKIKQSNHSLSGS